MATGGGSDGQLGANMGEVRANLKAQDAPGPLPKAPGNGPDPAWAARGRSREPPKCVLDCSKELSTSFHGKTSDFRRKICRFCLSKYWRGHAEMRIFTVFSACSINHSNLSQNYPQIARKSTKNHPKSTPEAPGWRSGAVLHAPRCSPVAQVEPKQTQDTPKMA